MDAIELIVLGRRLSKIGERAMRGSTGRALPTGVGLVLGDVYAHPGSSIGEVTTRTGLPQSYVSESIGRLRERGIIETAVDATDARRTLVHVSPDHPREVVRRGAVLIDGALADELAEADPAARTAMIEALEAVAARLRETSGPIGRQLAGARSEVA